MGRALAGRRDREGNFLIEAELRSSRTSACVGRSSDTTGCHEDPQEMAEQALRPLQR